MKNISAVLFLTTAVLFFLGSQASNYACGAEQQLEDIRTIIRDTQASDRSKATMLEDGEQLLSDIRPVSPDQNMTLTQLSFELANNHQSDHFKHTHRFVPEPSTLLVLALGGVFLVRRKR